MSAGGGGGGGNAIVNDHCGHLPIVKIHPADCRRCIGYPSLLGSHVWRGMLPAWVPVQLGFLGG